MRVTRVEKLGAFSNEMDILLEEYAKIINNIFFTWKLKFQGVLVDNRITHFGVHNPTYLF